MTELNFAVEELEDLVAPASSGWYLVGGILIWCIWVGGCLIIT